MKLSRTFRVLLRIVGVVGLGVGLFMIFVALLFLITKAPEVHLASLFFGLAITAVSVYCICGAPHLIRVIERKGQHDLPDA
jgi:uncharacterized membrane protein